jgi:tetratricopeptide (TPR) repeat protein
VHNALGALRQSARQWKAAEEEFQRAIELKPELLLARYNLGGLYFEMAKGDPAHALFPKAVASWQALVDRNASFVPAYVSLARALSRKNDFAGAVAVYDRILAQNDALPAISALRAEATGDQLSAGSQADEACEQYSAALSAAPADHRADLLDKMRRLCGTIGPKAPGSSHRARTSGTPRE